MASKNNSKNSKKTNKDLLIGYGNGKNKDKKKRKNDVEHIRLHPVNENSHDIFRLLNENNKKDER